jgi:galactokinase
VEIVARAPGRVNLIGDHTDYTGGLALPMAIQLGTVVRGESRGEHVVLRSADEPEPAIVPIDVGDPRSVSPGWARYVAGVIAEVRPATGFAGEVSTSIPIGSGLSSSAALEVAIALALGFQGTPLELAQACQRAEQRASGVPCGLMDQLASSAGVAGHALLMDFSSLDVRPVRVPDDAAIVVLHSGEPRALVGSAYADRRAECETAAREIGPLREATLDSLDRLSDPITRKRARHVVAENQRVLAFADALSSGDLATAGRLMTESHASLRDDFEVSTPALDALVERLESVRGVHGARLTGAGFGGCAVALTDPGVLHEGWTVEASPGARRD